MKILLIGHGQMGTMVGELALAQGLEVAAVFSTANIENLKKFNQPVDVLIDFSSPQALPAIAAYVERMAVPLVSGTTGFDEDAQRRLSCPGRLCTGALQYELFYWNCHNKTDFKAVFCISIR